MNNKRKKYVKVDRETGNDEIFALLDEVNSDLEDDINNLMNDLDTEFVLQEILLVPEANYHVAENPTIEKTLKEGGSKVEKDLKGKSK